MSTGPQSARWQRITQVVVIVALCASAIRPIMAYLDRAPLGESCFASIGCRRGECLATLNPLTGVCTRECEVDADCFGAFRCDPRFGMCLWMPTHEPGDLCIHPSQCRDSDCVTFSSPTTREFDFDPVGYRLHMCVAPCPSDGACPADHTCSEHNYCVPEAQVMDGLRRLRDAHKRALAGGKTTKP